mgnify:CR=1 FL=1
MSEARRSPAQSYSEYLEARIERIPFHTCWEWTGSITSYGYGMVEAKHRPKQHAHRAYWIYVNGSVPPGLDLDHLCRNRSCVNPAHLEPVTRKVNLARGMGLTGINARNSHWHRGHEFTPENIRIQNLTERTCRECDKLHHITSNNKRKLTRLQERPYNGC